MALRARNTNKMDGENADGRVKKVATTKHNALGEIGNRIVGLQNNSLPGRKLTNFKDVKAKVVTRHIVSKENGNPKEVLRKNSVVTASTVALPRKIVGVGRVAPVPRLPDVVVTDVEVTDVEVVDPAYSAELLQVEDIDKEEDPVLVPMYVMDIYKYLRQMENEYKIRPDYLAGQHVSSRMRSVLIDWLKEVHLQFHLLPETLYLNVAIIDRFLQDFRTIDRKRLQLVGVAAMSLASKYEEMFAPEIGDYVYISDNTYTKAQIVNMECIMLKALNFSFGRPLPLHFLRRYSKVAKADPIIHTLAKYFLELQLTDYKMCHLAPSLVAAASIFLSLWLLGGHKNTVWTNALMYYSTYSLPAITPVVRQLASLVANVESSVYQATRTKYASSKLYQISKREELRCDELTELANGSGDF